MSIRTIVFCDICNPRALKSVELRRERQGEERAGRRLTEGRAWLEGELSDAVANGWLYMPDGRHICPACRVNIVHR